MIYLNHAGTSWPKPQPVHEAVADALVAPPEEWPERLAIQHRTVSEAFGVPDPEALLLTPGATSSLAAAFRCMPLEAGDCVIVSALEHQALLGPAKALEQHGIEVFVAPRTDTDPVVLEAVEARLRQGRVRMLAMTAASNVTGEILPIDELVGLARDHGAISLIDAAQVAGWIPLDLPSLGADLVAFAGHKGPQAPWGIGGLFISSSCPVKPSHCDVGSVDRIALAGLAAGLQWLDEPAQRDRLSRARQHAETLSTRVRILPGVTLYGATPQSARMPIVALAMRGWSSVDLSNALADRGVVASGGQQCAGLAHQSIRTGADGVLRLSVGVSNTDSDAEQAADVLTEILTKS